MSLANCKECGSLYLKTKSDYCERCQKQQEEYYFKLREFLKANPRSTVMEAHKATGIPLSKVLELQKTEFIPFDK